MSFEESGSDNCRPTEFPEYYYAGEEVGYKLREGLLDDAAKLVKVQNGKIFEVQEIDPSAARRMKDVLALGMQCADPTDVHILARDSAIPTVDIDGTVEQLTNRMLGQLNRFSNSPIYDYNKLEGEETPQQAAERATANLQDPTLWVDSKSHPTMQEDFVADFNRRRKEDNYLPSFEAYIDSADQKVKIRYIAQ